MNTNTVQLSLWLLYGYIMAGGWRHTRDVVKKLSARVRFINVPWRHLHLHRWLVLDLFAHSATSLQEYVYILLV